MDMGLNSILATFAFHLGTMLPAPTEFNVIAGMPVVLPCPYDTKERKSPNKVFWKYEDIVILQFHKKNEYRVNRSATYTFGNSGKGNFSLVLPDAEKGRYTCEVDGKQTVFDIKVWKVTGTPSGYLLQGETLLLELYSFDMKPIRTEWFGPHKTKVTGKEPRWRLESNNRKLQIKNLAFEEDHGTWECHVLPDGPQIPYDVKVIGFLHPSNGNTTFAAVNSTISLSCSLNLDLQKEKSISEVLVWKWMKNNTILVEKQISVNTSNSLPVKEIPMVQFEDAGKYRCHLGFRHRYLEKTIHLIVMKVSADPLGLASKEANVTLCCHTSARLPSMAELCWVNANESRCDSHFPENKFCYVTRTAGQWRCDLIVKNSVKISINYLVAEAIIQHKFPLTEVASAASVLLLLLVTAGVCVPTCKVIQQKRKIAKRMTQAKQHLLAKRTCQCQRELTNDYYHA